MDKRQLQIVSSVDSNREMILKAERWLWAHPQTGYTEWEAHGYSAEIFEKLLIGYKKVSEEDTSGPVMKNTQQVYAGLTYGRGTLNEMYVNGNEARRGFMV